MLWGVVHSRFAVLWISCGTSRYLRTQNVRNCREEFPKFPCKCGPFGTVLHTTCPKRDTLCSPRRPASLVVAGRGTNGQHFRRDPETTERGRGGIGRHAELAPPWAFGPCQFDSGRPHSVLTGPRPQVRPAEGLWVGQTTPNRRVAQPARRSERGFICLETLVKRYIRPSVLFYPDIGQFEARFDGPNVLLRHAIHPARARLAEEGLHVRCLDLVELLRELGSNLKCFHHIREESSGFWRVEQRGFVRERRLTSWWRANAPRTSGSRLRERHTLCFRAGT